MHFFVPTPSVISFRDPGEMVGQLFRLTDLIHLMFVGSLWPRYMTLPGISTPHMGSDVCYYGA